MYSAPKRKTTNSWRLLWNLHEVQCRVLDAAQIGGPSSGNAENIIDWVFDITSPEVMILIPLRTCRFQYQTWNWTEIDNIRNAPLKLLKATSPNLPGADALRQLAARVEKCDSKLDQLQQVHVPFYLRCDNYNSLQSWIWGTYQLVTVVLVFTAVGWVDNHSLNRNQFKAGTYLHLFLPLSLLSDMSDTIPVPMSVSLFMPLSIFESVSLSVPLSVSIIWVFVCVDESLYLGILCPYLCISISICVCVLICVSVSVSMSVSISVSASLSVPISVSMSLSISLSVWTRGYLGILCPWQQRETERRAGKLPTSPRADCGATP